MKYAKGTDVSVEKSKAEIERIVMRYGATGFASGWMPEKAVISFEMKDRRVRFTLPLPDKTSEVFTHFKVNQTHVSPRTPESASRAWEQACRQRWRALLLIVKAKLEAVESGITTFEEEFLPHIVTADGMTIAEKILPQLPEIASSGRLPPLLPAPPEAEPVEPDSQRR